MTYAYLSVHYASNLKLWEEERQAGADCTSSHQD